VSTIQERSYRVTRGAVKLPRASVGNVPLSQELIMQGDLLPNGIFSELELRSWLREGRIEVAEVSAEVVDAAVRVRAANPFRVDPSSLIGKTMEDLIIMVLEIDEGYDTDALEGEADAVRLLSSGWDPRFREPIAPVNDRSRPEALAINAMEQNVEGDRAMRSTNSEMSSEASAGLARAKAAADAPDSQE
jgi:hypothetical protein